MGVQFPYFCSGHSLELPQGDRCNHNKYLEQKEQHKKIDNQNFLIFTAERKICIFYIHVACFGYDSTDLSC